ncbi:MAG TPA: hypothetical protein VJH37_01415 [Candidatus Nanoarchaeia archaeon]|nr:hypothetical protein [Candidatus Nanoarchaeia archaeon]
MQKKGDSQIISWVLLVGFVIGLATIVTMWVKDRAESSTKDQIDLAEQEIRCAETSINIAVEDCVAAPNLVKVTNTGKFTIQKIKFRQGSNFNDQAIIIIPQTPSQTVTLNTNINPLQSFDALPIIEINGKEVVCATRKVTFTC